MNKKLLPAILIFIFVNTFCLIFGNFLVKKTINPNVLLWGNIIAFGANIISYFLYKNALKADKSYKFLGGFYGAFVIKFIIVLGAAGIYIFTAKPVNKAGLIGSMLLYLIYSFSTAKIVSNKTK